MSQSTLPTEKECDSTRIIQSTCERNAARLVDARIMVNVPIDSLAKNIFGLVVRTARDQAIVAASGTFQINAVDPVSPELSSTSHALSLYPQGLLEEDETYDRWGHIDRTLTSCVKIYFVSITHDDGNW